jgi:hypothetical protein
MQRLDFLTRYIVRGVTVVGEDPEPAPSPWRTLYVWDRFPDQYQPLSVQGTQAAPGKLAARGYVDPYQVLRRTQGPYGNLVSGQVEFVP